MAMSRDDEDRPYSREDSPLLGSDSDHEDTPKLPPRRTAYTTPLPVAQLAAVYAIKLVVPVANTQTMPYVNKMVAGFDLSSKRGVGYYTGVLSFGHTAGQIVSIYAWGRLSGKPHMQALLAVFI
jgi:hypothetical protein